MEKTKTRKPISLISNEINEQNNGNEWYKTVQADGFFTVMICDPERESKVSL
ncbi:MAG: hypothetical protein U5K69_22110 [Balneolaceae bacterium]|nr:hypothetical protein [Balneolaceae bacterium]